jgi:hypothetical protein
MGARSVAKELRNKMFMSAHVNDNILQPHMTAKNMDVTHINLLHKICCNIQKTDHMMGTYDKIFLGKKAKW